MGIKMMIVKQTETRIQIALKVFQWSPEVADEERISAELGLTTKEFNLIDDEQFFRELFMYVHERDVFIGS